MENNEKLLPIHNSEYFLRKLTRVNKASPPKLLLRTSAPIVKIPIVAAVASLPPPPPLFPPPPHPPQFQEALLYHQYGLPPPPPPDNCHHDHQHHALQQLRSSRFEESVSRGSGGSSAAVIDNSDSHADGFKVSNGVPSPTMEQSSNIMDTTAMVLGLVSESKKE